MAEEWFGHRRHHASFRDYVMVRKYDYGRGSPGAWQFIAQARGDDGFPDARSWRDLQTYLESRGASGELLKSARSVWRSFAAQRSRRRDAAVGQEAAE